MSFDIYGNTLRSGHCEVHPHVHEEYPCSVCIMETAQREQQQRPPYCDGNPNFCESAHHLAQASEHIKDQERTIATQQARIEALESQNKQLLERRDTEYLRMLEWRGIDGIENACERCGGSGTAVYGSTSTWRGGAGGQMITSDICDRCWGSGDKSNKWTNLRRLPRLQPPEREGE